MRRTSRSGGVTLENRAVPVIDRKARDCLANLLCQRGYLGQQQHQVVADKAADRTVRGYQTRCAIG